MLDYTILDIKSAMDFAKENPTCTVEDWRDHRSNTLTAEERDLFKDINFTKINIKAKKKKCELFLFYTTGGSQAIHNLVDKYIGNKPYWSFYTGDSHGGCYSLIS